jgi:hypothetical protein
MDTVGRGYTTVKKYNCLSDIYNSLVRVENLGNLGIDGRIILKCMLKKANLGVDGRII